MNEILDNFEELLDSNVQTQEPEPPVQEPQEPQEPTQEPEPPQQEPIQTEEEPDYSNNSIYLFLQERGIKDPGKIVFTNEDDSTEELDFNSLTPEEQLEILKQVTDPGLTEDEVYAINFMRQNHANLNQIIDHFSQERLNAYLNEHPEAVHQKKYEIDEYSDDDLYVIDLKNRYSDLTDEEVMEELEAAKANEELFKKKTEALRAMFKTQEDQAEAAKKQEEEQQLQDFRNNLMNAASTFNEIQLDFTDDKSDSLVIEDADKQQVISYIMNQDSEGNSQLVKDLQDPDRLIEIAWFATQGPKVLSELTQYWKNLLSKERSENKKLHAQIDKLNKINTSAVVVPQEPKKPNDTTKVSV